jgi:hypothetical protein
LFFISTADLVTIVTWSNTFSTGSTRGVTFSTGGGSKVNVPSESTVWDTFSSFFHQIVP